MAKKKKVKKLPVMQESTWTITSPKRVKPVVTFTASTNTLSTLIPSYGKFLQSGKKSNGLRKSSKKRKS